MVNTLSAMHVAATMVRSRAHAVHLVFVQPAICDSRVEASGHH